MAKLILALLSNIKQKVIEGNTMNQIKNTIKCLQANEWLDVPDKLLNIVKNDLRE